MRTRLFTRTEAILAGASSSLLDLMEAYQREANARKKADSSRKRFGLGDPKTRRAQHREMTALLKFIGLRKSLSSANRSRLKRNIKSVKLEQWETMNAEQKIDVLMLDYDPPTKAQIRKAKERLLRQGPPS